MYEKGLASPEESMDVCGGQTGYAKSCFSGVVERPLASTYNASQYMQSPLSLGGPLLNIKPTLLLQSFISIRNITVNTVSSTPGFTPFVGGTFLN